MENLLLFLFLMTTTSSKLINVIQINRHGARSAENFKNEKLELFFGSNKKLSQNGYRQQQILGNYIRNRYIIQQKFLSSEYNPREFRVISTPTQRTIFSANGFISGLYPGSIVKTSIYEPGLNLIKNDTIPVPDVPKDFTEIALKVMSWTENSIFNTWNCRLNGKVLKEEAEDKTIYPDLLAIPQEELDETAQILARYYNKQKELDESGSLVFMKQINKYVVPDFYHFNKDYVKEIGKPAYETIKKMYLNKWYNARNRDSLLLKLGVSELFNKILSIYKESIQSELNSSFLRSRDYYKYTVYSSHDTAFANILSNMIDFGYIKNKLNAAVQDKEAYDFLVCPYASNILFELHSEAENQFYVKVIYNGVEMNYPFLDGVKADGEARIAFNDFEKLMKNRITPEWSQVDCSEAKRFEYSELFPYPSSKDYQIVNGIYYVNGNE